MPAKQVKKSQVVYHSGTNSRAIWFQMTSYNNLPEWPAQLRESPLSLYLSNTQGCAVFADNGTVQYLDASNDFAYHSATAQPWNERLYATVYTRFADAARQGSAEWGMNVLQGRKALGTLIQLSVTAATVLTAFKRAHAVPLRWLASHLDATPRSVARLRKRRGRQLTRAKTASERRRISNEIWLLDQVSSTLLAYRYGVAPLMSDIASTTQILSKEFDDNVSLRKSGKQVWSGSHQPRYAELVQKYEGIESVVLRATVRCSNPNLLLANRLGITNPQMWLWDATPWSFVLDWWFPVGSFLSSFTALVGLDLVGASVTRTRSWRGQWIRVNSTFWTSQGQNTFYGKVKVRTTGSLPIPLSVPYGTGLGIHRGQNALALITQKLIPSLKRSQK